MAPDRVVAVVAAFHPDHGFAGRLEGVIGQVAATVVVDDGSATERSGPAQVEWLRHSSNRGIAAALNTGIARARELGATHVLTLDQDTELAVDYVATALGVFSRARGTRVGAAVADVINGTPSRPTWTTAEGLDLAPEAIQSGMLVAVACLDAVGGFDERLVIDSVDREFCHRVRAHGWAVAIAGGAAIRHEIGRLEPLRGGGAYEWHEPFRQYYIVRNGIVVARRFRREERQWSRAMLRSTWDEARRIVRNGPRSGRHAIATVVGGIHGLVGRLGRLPRWLERVLR